MNPRANRSLPPPFFEIGAMKFQEICSDLLAEDAAYLNPVVYGRNGQSQRGIDIEAPLRQPRGLHVGQCKAWEAPSPAKVRAATKEFLPHARYWCERGLKRFILLIGCAVDDTKTQDQLRRETSRFRFRGIEYDWWDARILRRKLAPYPHIVRNHCEPADYWVDFICGNASTGFDTPGAAVQAGLSSLITRQGALLLELSDARDKELDGIRILWDEGRNSEALARIEALSASSNWQELTPRVRAKALRIKAGLLLATSSQVSDARRLLEQAKLLAPDECLALEAIVVRYETGVADALQILRTPTNIDAWNVRLGLLLESGSPESVLDDLRNISPGAKPNLDIEWSKGMALLCLRRVEEARVVIGDALKQRPRSFALRMAMAMVQYAQGISTVFSGFGHLTWPIPPPWHLVKRDDHSRHQRRSAGATFAELASTLSGDERNELLAWRIACLANEPQAQNEAATLCNSVLAENPGFMPALVWAMQRDYDFDISQTVAALRARTTSPDVGVDEVIALFALVAETEGLVAGEHLLDEQRPRFEEHDRLFVWKTHKAQILVARGENGAALDLAEGETTESRKRGVREAALAAIARRGGDRRELSAEYEAEFRETGDGDALLSCCLTRRALGDWVFISDHAEKLVELVATDAALRIAAEGCLNAHRPDCVLKLLQQHIALCPGGILPPDLERIRAEALKQKGHLGKAVRSAVKAAEVARDLATLAHLFRLQRVKGDLIGSAETARHFLHLQDVPPQFLTEEVAPAIRRIDPELTRALVLKAKESVPADSPVLLLVAQQASKLGLTEIAHEVFGKLALFAEKGTGGVRPVAITQLSEVFRSQAESWQRTVRDYRRGAIPVHALAFHFNVVLARWFLEAPRRDIESGFPLRSFPLLTRHGALAGEEPSSLDSTHELFLDFTSLLLLQSLHLLAPTERAFPKVIVPAHLTQWIQEDIDKLQPEQPERIAAQERALHLFESGKITCWEPTPDFTTPNENWAQLMGSAWCERISHAKMKGAILVDFLPLKANQPDMQDVVLPEHEARCVIGILDVIRALSAAGRVPKDQVEKARHVIGNQHSAGPGPSPWLQSEREVHLEAGIAEELSLLDVLDPLVHAARVVVLAEEVSRWRQTVERARGDAVLVVELEGLLRHLSHGFDSEQYHGHECPKPHVPDGMTRPVSAAELSTQDTFDYAEKGSGILCVDDRFLRGLRRGSNRQSADIYDIVHHLHQAGKLTEDELFRALGKMRGANLRYLPFSEPEIVHHLANAPLQNGQLVETNQLRILRRATAAMLLDGEFLQPPQETPEGQRLLLEATLPSRLFLTAGHSMVTVWRRDDVTLEHRAAQVQWIWKALWCDLRLLKEMFSPEGPLTPAEAVGHSIGYLFGQGIVLPGGKRGSARATYYDWLYSNCVAPYLINNPQFLQWVIPTARRMLDESLREIEEAERTGGKNSDMALAQKLFIGSFIADLPAALQNELRLSEPEFRQLGIRLTQEMAEVLGVEVEQAEFLGAVTRALERGYATIVKGDTRLQLRRYATGIQIKRKGRGATDGGNLDLPFLHLLAADRHSRKAALELGCSYFDLNQPDRESLFVQLIGVPQARERMRQLNEHLQNSAAWLYAQIEKRLRDRRRSGPDISDLLPKNLRCLRRHLRLEPADGSSTEPRWDEAVSKLLEHEGLEETVTRIACLPVRMPDEVFTRLRALPATGRNALLTTLGARLQSPLQRIHFLTIGLLTGDDETRMIRQAQTDLRKLLAGAEGSQPTRALLALVKWTSLRLGWSVEGRSWSGATRLRVAWVHAGRILGAFATVGTPHHRVTEWIESNSQEVTAESIGFAPDIAGDATISTLTTSSVLMAAVADLAAQLPAETVTQLNLPAIFREFAPTDTAQFLVLCDAWHDEALKTNLLGSYLGQHNELGLRRFVGDELYQSVWSTTPSTACELAIEQIKADPYQSGPWQVLLYATHGASLPANLATALSQVIERIDLAKALDRDPAEAEQLTLFTSDFGFRGSITPNKENFLEKLRGLARGAAKKFSDTQVMATSDTKAERVAAAILESIWRCSVTRGDEQATLKNLEQYLPSILPEWPAIAQLAHSQVIDVVSRIPFAYQDYFWRTALNCRAWA